MSSVKSKTPCNSLCRALKKGSIDSVRQALLKKENDLNHEDPCGYIPLHFAIQRGCNDKTVKLLIDAGSDIRLKNSDGNTPLHIAFEVNNEEIAEILMAAGAHLNVKNQAGITPLHLGVRQCGLGMLKSMFDAGADINSKSEDGKTLLHFAAVDNNTSVIKYLISHGIDVNVKDSFGQTPLHCIGESIGPVEKDRSPRGPQTFHKAGMGGERNHSQMSAIDLLFKNGADANALNNQGETPLQIFARNSSDDVMDILVKHTTKLNVTDDQKVAAEEKQLNDPKPSQEKKERDVVINLLRDIRKEIAFARKEDNKNQEGGAQWETLEKNVKDLLLTII